MQLMSEREPLGDSLRGGNSSLSFLESQRSKNKRPFKENKPFKGYKGTKEGAAHCNNRTNSYSRFALKSEMHKGNNRMAKKLLEIHLGKKLYQKMGIFRNLNNISSSLVDASANRSKTTNQFNNSILGSSMRKSPGK